MLRKWVKILPYFMIERYILETSPFFCKLDGDPVQAWAIRDGVFLVKSQKRVLLERKWELERELNQVEKRINGETCTCDPGYGFPKCPVHDKVDTD